MRQTHSRHNEQSGFALVYIALLLTLLLIFAGLAVDSGRAYMVKAQLTKAVDGAALGAARMLNSGNPRAQAVELFNANYPPGYYRTTGDPTAPASFYTMTTDLVNAVNVVTVTATSPMPTTFMRLANHDVVPIRATAVATRRMVDLCLVLDTSGSLGAQWPAVRDAARAFVNAFDEVNDRFCLVTYSSGAPVRVPMILGRGFNLNVTKTAAVVIDSGPQNTVRFGAGPLRFGSQVVARRIDVFGPFRAVMAGRIGTWVARDCHIRVNKPQAIAQIPQSLPGGFTIMSEGLYRGWDELRTVPNGQQSSLRIIVLFTDGAANTLPGDYGLPAGTAKGLSTADFPFDGPGRYCQVNSPPSTMPG